MHIPMPSSKNRIAGALAGLGLAAVLVTPALAQDLATPVPGAVVPGSECTAERRSVDFLGVLIATPAAGEAYVAPTAVPEGAPVDEQTANEIGAAVREFIACSNSGDLLRALSLLSDDYLRRIVDPSGELDVDTANEIIESLATPVALDPEQQVIFVGIREMVRMPDRRVAVVLETDGGIPNAEGTDVDLFIFERIGNRWIIDDAVNDIDDIEAMNTPEAGS